MWKENSREEAQTFEPTTPKQKKLRQYVKLKILLKTERC